MRPDNIGDVVTAGPVVRALRTAAPHARIDLLASPAGAQVAPLLPGLDGVLVASPSWQQLGSVTGDAGEWDLLRRLSAGGYDTMVVLTTLTQSPWPVAHLGLLAGIGRRVLHSVEFGGAVATHWVTPPGAECHQVDRGLHLLAAVGLAPPDADASLGLDVPDSAQREADAVLTASGVEPATPFVALAPGASCSSRCYPPARFAAAAARIAAAGLPVRVTGSPAESDLAADVVARARHPGVRVLAPTSVPGFAGVLRRAAVALTNNSGGLHIADALGTPVVATWSGTDPQAVMRPRGVPARLLGKPVACSPCRLLTCPYDHGCLDIDPAAVAEAVAHLAVPVEVPC